MRRVSLQMSEELGHEPTDDELAEETELKTIRAFAKDGRDFSAGNSHTLRRIPSHTLSEQGDMSYRAGDRLRFVTALAAKRSFTAAASECTVTQPTPGAVGCLLSRLRHYKPFWASVLVRKEFLIDAKIHPDFRRIWTDVQGLRLPNNLSISFRHSILLQQILSPGWNHHFHTKRVEPARIFEQLPTVCATAQADQPDFTH